MHDDFVGEKEFQFFKKLSEYKVKYLLIGRQACVLYGLPLYTFDYDIAVENSSGNLDKLLKIAESLDLYPSAEKDRIIDKKVPIFHLENDIKIDVFSARQYRTIDNEAINFSQAFEKKEVKKDRKWGLIFYIPCIDDLIKFKKINPRPKDFEDIKALEIIAEGILEK